MDIGLEHLAGYIDTKSGIYTPKVLMDGDCSNHIMLAYYRNPLNHIFFNESIILASMNSFGLESQWQSGIELEQLFERACFLSQLLKKEEFI